MALYAVGDVQGCRDDLEALLAHIAFDPTTDTLWLVGDLVNRGPRSLDTLRLVRELGSAALAVLGNHDITLLAQAVGVRDADGGMDDVLRAADRDDWIDWLRHRPLLHHDTTLDTVMVHAGLLPAWTVADAARYAREVEALLRSEHWASDIGALYGAKPVRWRDDRTGLARVRLICNTLTRLRYVHRDGAADWKYKGAPDQSPDELVPWFQVAERASRDTRIVFGHWSTLGFYDADNVLGLDTGCVWGGALTAVRLDVAKPARISLDCAQHRAPQTSAPTPAR